MRTVTAKNDEATRARHPDLGHATKHRLVVLAGSSADAVAHAGGLVFDRVGAGWDVRIHLGADESDDVRALRVLGVRKRVKSMAFDASEWPDLLVIGPDVYRGEAQARRIVAAAARRQHTEVLVWGDEWPVNLPPGIGRVEHRLSTAARAFKVHALGAAGLPLYADETEQFHTGQHRLHVAGTLLPPA